MQYEDFRQLALTRLDQALDNRFIGSLGAQAPSFFSLEEGENPLFAMLMGSQLLIAGGNQPKQIKALIQQLDKSEISFKSLFAEEKHCKAFLKAYRKPTEISTAFYVLSLTEVRMPARLPKGKIRQAKQSHLELTSNWVAAFFEEVLPKNRPKAMIEKQAKAMLEKGDVYFWEEGQQLLSMAAVIRHLPKGKAISHVYTPKEFRGRGLASATVAMLSQKILTEGAEFCCLFTDQKNPISNKIYERIGYEQIGSFFEYMC